MVVCMALMDGRMVGWRLLTDAARDTEAPPHSMRDDLRPVHWIVYPVVRVPPHDDMPSAPAAQVPSAPPGEPTDAGAADAAPPAGATASHAPCRSSMVCAHCRARASCLLGALRTVLCTHNTRHAQQRTAQRRV
jgi:hypothetical protein